MTMKMPPKRRQSGFSLIEVLVSVLILSFGLLGLVGLQAKASQYSVSAEDTNRAALLANEITSMMLTQRTLTLPAATIATWNARVASTSEGLPNGAGSVSVDGGVATITIRWRAPSSTIENRYVTSLPTP